MNQIRNGAFTSSQIYQLMTLDRKGTGWGAPALRYLKQKQWEKKLHRSLDSDMRSKPTSWGTLLESRAYQLMPSFETRIQSTETLSHPDIEGWVGTPDYTESDLVGDIKCPWTLLNFCALVDVLGKGQNLEEKGLKDEFPQYYWQLVSNSILTGKKFAELTVYCPFQEELEEIRELARRQDEDQERYLFINFALDDDLPYLVKEGEYKNLNQIKFEVPEADKVQLTETVKKALKLI